MGFLEERIQHETFIEVPGMLNDIVKVVRCKDCRWWHESESNKGFGDCGQANGITLKQSNWYCADGEVKEGLSL